MPIDVSVGCRTGLMRAEIRPATCRCCHERWTKAKQELVHCSLELASAKRELVPNVTAAVHAALRPTGESHGYSRRLWAKKLYKQEEIDVLEARVSGILGRISIPRTVVGQLIAFLVVVLPERATLTVVQGQIVGGQWVRAFQFR